MCNTDDCKVFLLARFRIGASGEAVFQLLFDWLSIALFDHGSRNLPGTKTGNFGLLGVGLDNRVASLFNRISWNLGRETSLALREAFDSNIHDRKNLDKKRRPVPRKRAGI